MNDFSKLVKIALINSGKTQNWLVDQLNRKTGSNYSRAYVCNVINGNEKSKKIVAAIKEILNL